MYSICPTDGKSCMDDTCHGSGVCLATGNAMLDRCDICRCVYSRDYSIECACEEYRVYEDYDRDDEERRDV